MQNKEKELIRPQGIDSDWLALEFTVPKEFAGWRADLFISNRIPRLSRTRIQKILKTAGFDSQGHPVKPNRILAAGESITLYRPRPEEPSVQRFFGVLHEDEDILGVDKPAGLPVHPTARYHLNTLTALLREQYGPDRPILAHRIDSETSGIVLCAKNRQTESALKLMFAERRIEKTYLAIVRGVPTQDICRIEAPIGPDHEGPIRVKMTCRPDGLPALTEIRFLKSSGDYSLLECRPRTGRQHQIRVHLAHLGFPIVGDKMYGQDPGLFLDYIENGLTQDVVDRAGASRHFLHAHRLDFFHPTTGVRMKIESPLPEDMTACFEEND